jgi:hypothetical protein
MGPIHISRHDVGVGKLSAPGQTRHPTAKEDFEANKNVTLCGQTVGPNWPGDDVVYRYNGAEYTEAVRMNPERICTLCKKVGNEQYNMHIP